MVASLIRVFAYIRQSTGKQKVSPETQMAAIRDWCEETGAVLVDIYHDDVVSSGVEIENRPAGKRMMADLEQRKADVVVFYRLDRGFRDNVQPIVWWRKVSKWGVRPVFLDMPHLDKLDVDIAETSMYFSGLMGKGERRAIMVRTKNALEQLKKDGRVYSHVTPYGKTRTGDGLLIDNTAEQKAIALMVTRQQEGAKWTVIADELNRKKIPSRSGAPWSKQVVQKLVERALGVKIRKEKKGVGV